MEQPPADAEPRTERANDAHVCAAAESQLSMVADVAVPRKDGEPLPAWTDMTWSETIAYVRTESLLGVIVAFAQVPESVSFAFLAHVRPPVALHSAWIVGLVCALFGGRPGMISGASGAFAAIIGTFIPKPDELGGSGEGVELLFPSVMLAGVLMTGVRLAGGARFITLIPESVMVGFCDGLAIVIARAQLHPFSHTDSEGHVHWKEGAELGFMLLIMLVSMLIMEFLPKLPWSAAKLVPSSLVAIVVASLFELFIRTRGFSTDTIGDVAQFTADSRFPVPFFLDTQYDLSVLRSPGASFTIIKQAIMLCAVGVVESLMTTEVVTEIVKTPVDRNAVLSAMGGANVLAGFLGGMGGNAMLALSQLSCLSGGRGRIAPTVTALLVMACVMGAYPLLNHVPISALTGVMLVVVIHTFRWTSLPYFVGAVLPRRVRARCRIGRFQLPVVIDRWEALVAVVVAVITVLSNLVYAVVAGVVLVALRHAWAASHLVDVTSEKTASGRKVYTVRGHLFFGNAMRFGSWFDPHGDPDEVELHVESRGKHDLSTQTALSKLQRQYEARGKRLTVLRRSPSGHAHAMSPAATSDDGSASANSGTESATHTSDKTPAKSGKSPAAAGEPSSSCMI